MNGNNILNRFLEIAVYPAAGGDSCKQFAQIIIGKDQRSCSLGHFCSFYSHCHTYMCSLKRWTVINSVAQHGYHLTILLKRIYYGEFGIGEHSCKENFIPDGFPELLLTHRCNLFTANHFAVSYYSGLCRNGTGGLRIVTSNHFNLYSGFINLFKNLTDTFFRWIVKHDESQKLKR